MGQESCPELLSLQQGQYCPGSKQATSPHCPPHPNLVLQRRWGCPGKFWACKGCWASHALFPGLLLCPPAALSPQDFPQTHHKPQQYFTFFPYLFFSEFSETRVLLGRFNSCIWTRCPHRVTRCPPMQIQLNKVKGEPKKFTQMNVISTVQSHMLI